MCSCWLLLLLLAAVQQLVAGNQPPDLQICDSLNSTYATLSSTSCLSNIDIRILEEVPIGTDLIKFTASDPENNDVTMTLTGGAEAALYFSLSSVPSARTAVLKVNSRIDSEAWNINGHLMPINILLNDGNGNTRRKEFSIVLIVDINDNGPEFQKQPYRWEIPENTLSPSINFTVQVIDRDPSSAGMSIEFKEVSGSDITGIFNFSSVSSSSRNPGKLYTRSIVLQQALDYESSRFYQISVNATDLTTGGISQHSDIIINVLDKQDTKPFFEGVPYLRSIAENSSPGTHVVTLVAKDGDRGIPNAVTYEMVASQFSKYFSLNSTTGDLTIGSAAVLDRESAEILAVYGTIELPVIAKEVSSPPQPANISQATTTVRIVVLDTNDFRPQFSSSLYNATVLENTQVGAALTLDTRIFVQDLDAAANGDFNLTVTQAGQPYLDFLVTPVIASREASVTLLVNNVTLLDYESVQSVTFQLLATETRTAEKFSSTATVQLSIIDMNDNRPVFNQTKYVFTVAENSAMGTYVGTVAATDRDSGKYGTVTYGIDGTDAGKFLINATSGEIFVNVNADSNHTLLDRERFATIFLTLQATDGGGFVTSIQLEISLSDVNDKTPAFTRSSYTAVLKENSLTFDTAVQVEAVDADEKASLNSQVVYSIASGNVNSSFSINSNTGVISIAKPVDYEALADKVLNVTVMAADRGSPSLNSTVIVQVTVVDANDNAPTCSQRDMKAQVMENATSGQHVLKLNATDADAPGSDNSQIFFRIQGGAADKFAIDGGTGDISVERGADLDINRYGSNYNLTVMVYDRGSPQLSTACLVSISVQDVNNQKPYFPSATRREAVSEGLSIGSHLPVAYTATDPDSSARLEYSILVEQMRATQASGQAVQLSVYNYTALFSIVPGNGTVVVTNVLDRERAEEVTLPIFVRDLAAETPLPVQTATGTLIITLTDVNDERPVFTAPAVNDTYRVTVSEVMLPPVDISLKVLAVDADKTGGPLVYSINPSDAFFDIHADTGQVSLKAALDRETASTHRFFVTVNDTVHVATATVLVTVADANDNWPIFQEISNTTVPENVTVGSVLTRLVANDTDSGAFGTVNYRLVSGGAPKFSVNSSTGELIVAEALDRDVTGGDLYSLVVEAFDNPGSSDSKRTTAPLTVVVTDINDNSPVFTSANFVVTSLQESAEADQLVTEIAATDADAGVNSQLSYQLSVPPATSARPLELFRVTTRKTGSSFTASIFTKVALKNAAGTYNVTLIATDAGNPSLNGSTVVTIVIGDINDFSPEFTWPNVTQMLLRVNESTNSTSTIGVHLLTAAAIDRDTGNNSIIRFSLTSSNGDHAAFAIDAISGELKVNTNLNREVKMEYRFQIKANDLGTPQLSSFANIVVDVVDVNESPPVFSPADRQQQLMVAENLPPAAIIPGLSISGVHIGTVAKAKDPDATAATAVVCYFVLDKVYDKFYLNKTTGELYALVSFDREAVSKFVLHIIAVSQSLCSSSTYEWAAAPKARARRSLDTSPVPYDPSNAAMTAVTVTITDVNDNPPQWSQSVYYGGVNVNEPPNTLVFNFGSVATDLDAGNNSQLTFSMTSVQPESQQLLASLQQLDLLNSVFQLDSSTGILRTGPRTYFQAAMSGSLTFNVSASDAGSTATAVCTIYVLSLRQQIVATVIGHSTNVTLRRDVLAAYLSNITNWRIVIDNIVTHKRADGTADPARTDVYLHAINPTDNSIIPAATLRDRLDLLWTEMRVLYRDYGLLSIKLAEEAAATDSIQELLRIALIVVSCALTIFLFFTCVSLWSCRRMYRRKLKVATADACNPKSDMERAALPGTNMHTVEGSNPLFLNSTFNLVQRRDNQVYETDKDSIDHNDIDDPEEVTFDIMEKSLNFNDDRDSTHDFHKDSKEILNSAVNAGPDAAHQNGSFDITTAPNDLTALPSSNI